ncbi:hypothetical protein AVEN_256742-1 [Araneus ventricosus]|uniref:Uncharacterized protein n=1 Tax=Araneus ventricosus TaxID=182803 RepID=A0A4Y2FQT9_ARAVE|nr:hypothetical protein AVEN_256742-1 [Araneus ventricosus]
MGVYAILLSSIPADGFKHCLRMLLLIISDSESSAAFFLNQRGSMPRLFVRYLKWLVRGLSWYLVIHECNCGPYGSCSFQYGQKTCNCRPFAFEKNGICIIMESTTSEDTTAVRTTMLPSTTQYCNCGEYSKSCRYNWKGDKTCDCFRGYAEKYGSCEGTGPYF